MSFVHGLPAFKTSSMSPIAAQKITEMIASFWRDYKDCVFCRFLHAEEGMDASLVYAMPITPEVTLAFTYPEGFDLRAIRQETANLRDIFIIGRYAIRTPQKIFHPVSPLRTMNSSMWLLLFR